MMLSQMTECAFRIQTLRRQITPGEYDRSLCSMKTALTGSSPEECKNTLCFINEQLVSSLGKATACKALRNSGLSYNNLNLETYTVEDTCPVSDAAVRRLTLLSRSSSELKLPPAASPKLEAILEPVIKFVVFADMGHASVLAPPLETSAPIAQTEPPGNSEHQPKFNHHICGQIEALRIIEHVKQIPLASSPSKRQISGVDVIVLLESESSFVVLDIWGAFEAVTTTTGKSRQTPTGGNCNQHQITSQQHGYLCLSDHSKSALGKRRREEALVEAGNNQNPVCVASQRVDMIPGRSLEADPASNLHKSQSASTKEPVKRTKSAISGSSRSHLVGLRILFPDNSDSSPGAPDSKWRLNIGVTTSL